jgi:hypothetical protein
MVRVRRRGAVQAALTLCRLVLATGATELAEERWGMLRRNQADRRIFDQVTITTAMACVIVSPADVPLACSQPRMTRIYLFELMQSANGKEVLKQVGAVAAALRSARTLSTAAPQIEVQLKPSLEFFQQGLAKAAGSERARAHDSRRRD